MVEKLSPLPGNISLSYNICLCSPEVLWIISYYTIVSSETKIILTGLEFQRSPDLPYRDLSKKLITNPQRNT